MSSTLTIDTTDTCVHTSLSKKAAEAQSLRDEMAEQINLAAEAMRRATRVRRVTVSEHPEIKYEQVF